MDMVAATRYILNDLKEYLQQIDRESYVRPLQLFSDATLGQHTRHIVEFFQCLLHQQPTGLINYDKRVRNHDIETDIIVAVAAVDEILSELTEEIRNRELQLEVSLDTEKDLFQRVATSWERELAFAADHAIHHMAIIKIGVKAIAPEVKLPEDFGVAPSTIKYKKEVCVR